MKPLICEMCGGSEFINQGGMLVCKYCGCKYSMNEAVKQTGSSVPVASQGTVGNDSFNELYNLYTLARRAKTEGNNDRALKYYEMILLKEPNSWEACFYVVYFEAYNFNPNNIEASVKLLSNCLYNVLFLIKENVQDKERQINAFTEVAYHVLNLSIIIYNYVATRYNSLDAQTKPLYNQELLNDTCSVINCLYLLGDNLDYLFTQDKQANSMAVKAWKQGVEWHKNVMPLVLNKKTNRQIINKYFYKIKKYDYNYTFPKTNIKACYIATSVYGSYDCPEVWTLRRYRDYVLDKNLLGRAFIHIYYTVSPIMVRMFGNTGLFKRIWRCRLNHIVKKLQEKGFESSPYNDISR